MTFHFFFCSSIFFVSVIFDPSRKHTVFMTSILAPLDVLALQPSGGWLRKLSVVTWACLAFCTMYRKIWCNNDCNKVIYPSFKVWLFCSHPLCRNKISQTLVKTCIWAIFASFFKQRTWLLQNKWRTSNKTPKMSSSLTCSKISVSSAVSGMLLGWADMTAESTSGLIVTPGLPVTPLNATRTNVIRKIIIECRKARMAEKSKKLLLWKSAGGEMSCGQCGVMQQRREGQRREETVQILLSSCFVLLTKQTAPLYLVLFFIRSCEAHLSCQPLNVSTPSQDELISSGTVIPLQLLLVKQLWLKCELDELQPRLRDSM